MEPKFEWCVAALTKRILCGFRGNFSRNSPQSDIWLCGVCVLSLAIEWFRSKCYLSAAFSTHIRYIEFVVRLSNPIFAFCFAFEMLLMLVQRKYYCSQQIYSAITTTPLWDGTNTNVRCENSYWSEFILLRQLFQFTFEFTFYGPVPRLHRLLLSANEIISMFQNQTGICMQTAFYLPSETKEFEIG